MFISLNCQVKECILLEYLVQCTLTYTNVFRSVLTVTNLKNFYHYVRVNGLMDSLETTRSLKQLFLNFALSPLYLFSEKYKCFVNDYMTVL